MKRLKKDSILRIDGGETFEGNLTQFGNCFFDISAFTSMAKLQGVIENFCITSKPSMVLEIINKEVAMRNTRRKIAHKEIGFVVLHEENGSFSTEGVAGNSTEAIIKFLSQNVNYLNMAWGVIQDAGYILARVEIQEPIVTMRKK